MSEAMEVPDTLAAIDAAERAMRQLLCGEFSSLTIGFNDAHACNYQNAQQWADDEPPFGSYNDLSEWLSPEDREKALSENSVWSIQWYPNTPVGFCRVYGSSLSKALQHMLVG